MKKLDNKVNIIPIIAKADIVSRGELNKFKSQVHDKKLFAVLCYFISFLIIVSVLA